MALNLWVMGGKPASYNPLPIGWGNTAPIGIGNYTVTVKAKSASNARLYFGLYPTIVNLPSYTLSNDFQTFTFTFSNTLSGQVLRMSDYPDIKGDIIIDSISVVQAPLPKLTINGLDGFNSGKWVPSSNSTMTVNDDSSVTMNATASWASVSLSFIPVLPNTKYDLTVLCSGGGIRADEYASDKTTNTAQNNGDYTQSSLTFTTQSNTYYLIIYLGNGALGVGSFTFKQPMLNLGSIPAPYSPKTGDRMVMPTPKGNLLPDFSQWTLSSGATLNANGELVFTDYGQSAISPYIPLNNTSKIYYSGDYYSDFDAPSIAGWSSGQTGRLINISYFDSNKNPVIANSGYSSNGNANHWATGTWSGFGVIDSGANWATGSQVAYVRIQVSANSSWTSTNMKVRSMYLGTYRPSTYTPYAVQKNKLPQRTDANGQPTVLPPANKGLSFNGVTDYITFPNSSDLALTTLTMEFLVNFNQLKDYGVLLQKGVGGGASKMSYALWTYASGVTSFVIGDGTTGYSLPVSNTPSNQWLHIVATYDGSTMRSYVNGVLKGSLATSVIPYVSSDSLYIGSYGTTASPNAAIKYINLYNRALSQDEINSRYSGVAIASGLVRNFDFTQQKNIVGTTVMQNAQNLIPSFEDIGWTINPNAKVIGKDVLHLDATTYSKSYIPLNVNPNTNYLIKVNGNGYYVVSNAELSANIFGWTQCGSQTIFNSGTNTVINIVVANFLGGAIAGSFDFIRPQLYQLDGTEGTIYGSPVQRNKPSKRSLYAKR